MTSEVMDIALPALNTDPRDYPIVWGQQPAVFGRTDLLACMLELQST